METDFKEVTDIDVKSYFPCGNEHAFHVPVFEFNDRSFYLGLAELMNSNTWDAVIDCSGGLFIGDNVSDFPAESQELHEYMTPIYQIAWPDFAPPPVKFSFWKKLYFSLPEGDIVVCCEGGHGRTGTAMAALLLASGQCVTAKEAIETVREKYCQMAIENDSQEYYLQRYEEYLAKP